MNSLRAAVVAVGWLVLPGACSRSPRDSPPGPLLAPVAQTRAAAPSGLLALPAPASAERALAERPASDCGDPGEVFVFVSPEHPVRGRPLRVIAVTERAIGAELTVSPAEQVVQRLIDGMPATPATTRESHGGPPYFWVAPIDAAAAGSWRAAFARGAGCGGAALASKDIAVAPSPVPSGAAPRKALWLTRAAWSPSLENLYSAWIDYLFDAPIDAQPTWSALHEVLRDRARNFLFDHLGAGEDEQGVVIRPDCADLPYFLRAYFAYKLGLPFGWSRCSRGEGGVAPTCADFATSADPFPPVAGKAPLLPAWADPAGEPDPREKNVKRVGEFFRTTLADAVQSGAGRTPADDETADYYPVSLSVDTLRPGTIFADPYGHVLVLAKRLPQTATTGGVLLAVDGQPDGTVARKRFWRGNFLFAIDPALGSAGFKRFRTLARDKAGGGIRRLKNAELHDFSLEQYANGVDGFYDKVEDVLSPAAVDPMQALLETIQALEEQVKTRASSVENGRRFLASGKPAAEMPDGAKIFETTGSWEDFSTPSRDLRLLIAVDVVRALPGRVARRPERYAMPEGKPLDQVQRELEARLAEELRARAFTYVRTDGTDWRLTLKDVADREASLEMAYNPNDCVEQRWGAPRGSDEASTCSAHAPAAQTLKMSAYRAWFHERRRPPR